MTPNDKPPGERLPVPRPPEPTGPGESLLLRLLGYRFLLVALVVLLFLGALFAWGQMGKGKVAPEEPQAVTAAPHEPGPEGPGAPEAPKGKEPEHAAAPAPPGAAHQEAPAPAPPPSIVFGKFGLTDNINHVQLGVLEVARRTVVVLNENFTRFATTEAYDPRVNEAMNFFMVSPDKYWFPSASGKYQEAMHDLEIYIENLRKGRSRFYSRVDHLIALLSNYKDLLGSSFHNLIKDTEGDGKPVSWWVTDDYFYFSQGIALGMAEMLEAVSKDFHPELQKKNSHKLLEDAIHALHSASHLKPWVVTNGAKDGILANHRANMSTYIGEAEHVISTLQMQLATN
jgi:hypothetical protein